MKKLRSKIYIYKFARGNDFVSSYGDIPSGFNELVERVAREVAHDIKKE